jgi:hypothetical protein
MNPKGMITSEMTNEKRHQAYREAAATGSPVVRAKKGMSGSKKGLITVAAIVGGL